MAQPERRKRQVDDSPIVVFKDEEFTDETIRLDGRTFIRCRFTRCILQFGGIEPVVLEGNEFHDCRWVFVGPAALTLGFLSALYKDGAHALLEETFNDIRQGGLDQYEVAPSGKTG